MRTAATIKSTESITPDESITLTETAAIPRLRRHLALIIALKLLALTLLWWFFFRADLRPPADTEATAARILAEQPAR